MAGRGLGADPGRDAPPMSGPDILPGETFLARVGRAARWLRWYVRGVIGADAYERYLEHHARQHCQAPALSEREFWRERTDAMGRDPKSRCC